VAFKSIFSRDAQYTRTIFEDIKRWENVTKNAIPNDRIYNMIYPLETSFGINHKSRNYDGKKFIDGFNDAETFFRLQTGFWKNEGVDELSGLKAEFYTKDLQIEFWFSKYDPRVSNVSKSTRVVLLDKDNNTEFPQKVSASVINIRSSSPNMLPYGEYDNNLHFSYNPEDAKNIKSFGDMANPKQILAEFQFNNHSVLKHSYDHEDDIGNDAQPIYWDAANGLFKTINLENLARALKDYFKGYFEPKINILPFSVSGKIIIDYNESTTLTVNLDGGNANNTQWS
jgi:hypothetical protein